VQFDGEMLEIVEAGVKPPRRLHIGSVFKED
jgi:hypothetical protein